MARRALRRLPAIIGAALAVAMVIGVALAAAVLVTDGDGERVTVSRGTSPSTSTTMGEQPSDPSPGPAPEFPQGTFQAFLDRATIDSDGTRYISITLPNGESVPLNVSAEGFDLIGGMFFQETFYVSCPSDPDCGDALAKAYPTAELPPGDVLQTLTGADGEPVLLVEHPLGRALRWVRAGWTIDVPLSSVPDAAHQRWSSGLTPFVDDQGWIQLRTSNGLTVWAGDGSSILTALLYSGRDAFMYFTTGSMCAPENDEDTIVGDLLLASRCHPSAGVLMNVQGKPDKVQFLLSVLRVG